MMNKYIFIGCIFFSLQKAPKVTLIGSKNSLNIQKSENMYKYIGICIHIYIYLLTYALELSVFTSLVYTKLSLLCLIFYGSIAVTHFCNK